MLKNPDGTYSLSRIVFAMAWIVAFSVAGKYLMTDLSSGAAVAVVIGALLTPAGAIYTMRAHSQGVNKGDPKCSKSN